MGNHFTCPFASSSDLENTIQSILVNSIGLGYNNAKHTTTQRSISFKGTAHDTDDSKKSLCPGKRKMVLEEGSISFKRRQNETVVSLNKEEEVLCSCIKSMEMDGEFDEESSQRSSDGVDFGSPKHEAAIKLQKVYKSFRTRRKLADCAVIAEQSWWKVLDFAELKHSSISFFDIEHHETAVSRWSRAKTRAAKVGKGLSKSDRAQKLALQHWLEAIDPRHRYGHNLHFYYVKWLQSQSREPFFYWLDIGEGKEVNLEKCPRWKLQQQCIKYLGPMGRKAYEVAVDNGKLFYLQSGEVLDTTSEPNAKWIFVLSTSKSLYVGKKKKGTFQHSSFLAGGATSAAGRLVVDNGTLRAVWPHSGHYKPTEENFQDFISYLKENNVDLTDVKMDPVDEDEASLGKQSSHHMRTCSSEEDLVHEKDENNNTKEIEVGRADAAGQDAADVPQETKPGHFHRLFRKLTNLQIPRQDELLVKMQSENNVSLVPSSKMDAPSQGSPGKPTEESIGSEYGDTIISASDKDGYEENREEMIPKESILQRINSHKEAKSYQLGRQLSCKWTSGAGPRIGCVRDYPSELQAMALEQVSLSPRSSGLSKSFYSSPRFMTAMKLSPKEMLTPGASFSHGIARTHSSPLATEIKSHSYVATQLKQES